MTVPSRSLHVTTAGHNAVRIMVDLAIHYTETPVLRQKIAERQEISPDYIAHLICRLNKAGLIKSVMGPAGGYALTRQPAQIQIGEIIRAVEGPVQVSYCIKPSPTGYCPRIETCTVHMLWMQLAKLIDDFLNGITLQDLCDKSTNIEHIVILQPDINCK